MISIIIPLYNKEKFVKRTIKSLLVQTFDKFEVLFIDDGSTDKSAQIVESIQDDRIKLIKKVNGGPSSARNLGVRNAIYDWILYLDADDCLLPNAIELFVNYIHKAGNYDCIFGNFFYERNGIKRLYSNYREGEIKDNFKSFVLGKCMPRTGVAVFRKKLLLQYPFRENIRRYEDLEQLFRLFKVANFYRIKEPVFIYNSDGSEAKYKRKNIYEDFLAYIKLEKKCISWENIALYKLYLLACDIYPDECAKLYPKYSKYIVLYFVTRIITNKYSEKLCKIL